MILDVIGLAPKGNYRLKQVLRQKNVKFDKTYYQPVHQEAKSAHELAFEKADKW